MQSVNDISTVGCSYCTIIMEQKSVQVAIRNSRVIVVV